MNKPAVYLSPKFQDAVIYSTHWHRDQTRKSTSLPYILHPLGVASLILEAGGDEELAIAGLLHDVPEDCGGEARLREIEQEFGSRVAEIVRACSDTLVEDRENKAPYQERKQAHLNHLANADDGILVVTAADKLHNARSIATDFLNQGDDLWARFNGSQEQILWYYESMYFLLTTRQVSQTLMTPLREAIQSMGGKVGLSYYFELDAHNKPTRLFRYGPLRGIEHRWDGGAWVDTKKVHDYFWGDSWLLPVNEIEAVQKFPKAFGL
jgi:hypothetical protein